MRGGLRAVSFDGYCPQVLRFFVSLKWPSALARQEIADSS